LDAAITTARNIKRKLVIANENKQVYALKDQIAQLSNQVNALAREESQRISTFNPLEGNSAKKGLLCFNYQNEGYIVRECN